MLGVAGFFAIGDGSGSGDETPVAPEVPLAPALSRVVDEDLGVRFNHPVAWTRSKQGDVWRLSSPDQTVALAISSPAQGSVGSKVRRDTLRTLRGIYGARVVGTVRTRLDGRRAASTELVGRTTTGRPIRVLSTVVATPERTYALALFTDPRTPSRRLVEAQSVLSSVRLAQ